MTTQQTQDVRLRWMVRRDLPAILQIEQVSFEYAWDEEAFLTCLRQRNCIGVVAEQNQQIMAFVVYELFKSHLQILNIAVAPDVRRTGIGTECLERLIQKLSQSRRSALVLDVRESNLPAQLFLRSCQFVAREILHDHYPDAHEDAYRFEYRLSW